MGDGRKKEGGEGSGEGFAQPRALKKGSGGGGKRGELLAEIRRRESLWGNQGTFGSQPKKPVRKSPANGGKMEREGFVVERKRAISTGETEGKG